MKNVKIVSVPTYNDDRGWLTQIYEKTNFPEIKRMYIVKNYNTKTVRAFHKNFGEWKIFYIIKGAAKFILHKDKKTKEYCLSDKKPEILIVGPEIWNGWKALIEGTTLLGMTTTTMKEHKDERCPPNSFNVDWDVKNR